MKKGELLNKAILFATMAHAGQSDKSGRPYILHSLSVMGLLGEDADEELQCIAVLHDVVEDGRIEGERVTFQMLQEQGFTPRIIDGTKGLTKITGQSPEEYENEIMKTSDRMLVKRSDLTHNSKLDRLKGVSDKDIERMAKYQRLYWKIEQKLRTLKSERKENCCFMTVEREMVEESNSNSYRNTIEQ